MISGLRLKELRVDAGYTTLQLAKIVGCDKKTIVALESGERSIERISLQYAYRLSKALGIKVDDLCHSPKVRFVFRD
jgi:DNA-binding XRE family transcriptional regulator